MDLRVSPITVASFSFFALTSCGSEKPSVETPATTSPVEAGGGDPHAHHHKPATDGRLAPVLPGMGDTHHAITTQVAEAQRFFDQGLVLAFAFNHAEANRSFLEGARLDPDCAMCYWGAAWVIGPNYNVPMFPEA